MEEGERASRGKTLTRSLIVSIAVGRLVAGWMESVMAVKTGAGVTVGVTAVTVGGPAEVTVGITAGVAAGVAAAGVTTVELRELARETEMGVGNSKEVANVPMVAVVDVVVSVFSIAPDWMLETASSRRNFDGEVDEGEREREHEERQEVANNRFWEGELFARRPRYDVCFGDSSGAYSFLVTAVVVGGVLELAAEFGEGGARAAFKKWIAIGSSPNTQRCSTCCSYKSVPLLAASFFMLAMVALRGEVR